MENSEKSFKDVVHDHQGASRAAADAFLIDIGKDIASLTTHMGWAEHTQVWVYQLQIKFPRIPLGQHMIVAKGIFHGEFVVAFHSNDGLSQTLTGLGRRIANGTLKWKDDEFPPHKADEIVAEWGRLVDYYRG